MDQIIVKLHVVTNKCFDEKSKLIVTDGAVLT